MGVNLAQITIMPIMPALTGVGLQVEAEKERAQRLATANIVTDNPHELKVEERKYSEKEIEDLKKNEGFQGIEDINLTQVRLLPGDATKAEIVFRAEQGRRIDIFLKIPWTPTGGETVIFTDPQGREFGRRVLDSSGEEYYRLVIPETNGEKLKVEVYPMKLLPGQVAADNKDGRVVTVHTNCKFLSKDPGLTP